MDIKVCLISILCHIISFQNLFSNKIESLSYWIFSFCSQLEARFFITDQSYNFIFLIPVTQNLQWRSKKKALDIRTFFTWYLCPKAKSIVIIYFIFTYFQRWHSKKEATVTHTSKTFIWQQVYLGILISSPRARA